MLVKKLLIVPIVMLGAVIYFSSCKKEKTDVRVVVKVIDTTENPNPVEGATVIFHEDPNSLSGELIPELPDTQLTNKDGIAVFEYTNGLLIDINVTRGRYIKNAFVLLNPGDKVEKVIQFNHLR